MRRAFLLALVLISAPASAQVLPSSIFPPGVTPPVFGAPASAVNGSGVVTSAQLLLPDGTEAAPALAFVSQPGNGLSEFTSIGIALSVSGTRYVGLFANALQLKSTTSLDWSDGIVGSASDVSLLRGAANRLDLASGDSFRIVSGGLGVGATETTAGEITATGIIAGLALTATQAATDTVVQQLSSTATSDDPTEVVRQFRATTTSGVAGAAATFTIPTSTSTLIKCSVVARRTGGAAGAAEDSAMYDIAVGVKNTAGTVAEIAAETLTVFGESQAGWTVTAAASGATEVISVTGATDNNVTWHLTCRTYGVNQ